MRRRAERKGDRKPAASGPLEIAGERGGKQEQQRDAGAAQGDVEGGKRHGSARWVGSEHRRSPKFFQAPPRHRSRVVTQRSTVSPDSSASPSTVAPSRRATACEASLTGLMQ